METLNIAFVSTNTYPTPPGGAEQPRGAYGGEIAWYDLCRSLDEMGHEVHLFAPPRSWAPPGGKLYFMRCSYGTSTPWFWESEGEMYDLYKDVLMKADVVHDGSHTKRVQETLYARDKKTNVVSTLIGSVWNHPQPPFNVVCWTEVMRQMGIRGDTGYEGTEWEKAAWNTPTGQLKDAHVVHGGTDTDYYAFEPDKEGYFLWYSRFHPSKGYQVAIDLAKRTKIPLTLMGDHPDIAPTPDHRAGALDAVRLAKGADNINFHWLRPGTDREAEKLRVLQNAKALLYTITFQECFGLVMVEALSCGTPVIGMKRGSVPELIRDGKGGRVCDTMDGLILAVREVDELNPDAARKEAVDRFDRRIMAENYEKEYRKVMDGEVWGL